MRMESSEANPNNRKRTVVIVGASNKPDRASYRLFHRLKMHGGYEPILVNPVIQEIDGTAVLPSLAEVPPHPDVVSLYVGAKGSKDFGSELARLKPGVVVFNPGAENSDLMDELTRHGVDGEEACSLVLLSQNAL